MSQYEEIGCKTPSHTMRTEMQCNPYKRGTSAMLCYLEKALRDIGRGYLKFGRKVSEKAEKAVTVNFEKHPPQKVGTRCRAVSAQGSRRVCPSRCPRSWNLEHFAICGKISSIFPGIFPCFSSGSAEVIPEPATAFWSFLKVAIHADSSPIIIAHGCR